MSYWGPGPAECDYAFDGIGVYIRTMSKRIFDDLQGSIDDEYKEQSVIAGLRMIRLLAKEFPKAVKLAFNREDFEKWYELCGKKVPKKYQDEFIKIAREELDRFESEVLGPAVNT